MAYSLFDNAQESIQLPMQDAIVEYHPTFLNTDKANDLFTYLYKIVPWQQDQITVYGKTYMQPRLTALYAINKNPYEYSNIRMYPHEFPAILMDVLDSVNKISKEQFTTCLVNLYRDGQDSNGWHADDEKELGPDPIIASLSLGEARWFHLKHKTNPSLKYKLKLTSGSLLLMKEGSQKNWLHQLPKSKRITEPRINLTFRKIL
ncbi:alpha-ketoglutarate-dependent dioxygenase AlkB family protein [Aquimarina sp. 2-A2]|uniref:alpha-ketoglutarate-dependent dioxygenase AlkB family protein n=1 Tax=Aquimarina sp. 2-A2 TaxID=3382644 RepID=UPI00387F1B18